MILFNPALSKSLQIAELIRQYIKENALAKGDKLPSIAKFATLYAVSKDSVNEAMALLSYEETVVIKPRHGIFVAGGVWKNLYPQRPEWSAYTENSIQKLNTDDIIHLYKNTNVSKSLFSPVINDRLFPRIITKGLEEAIKTVQQETVNNLYSIAGYAPLQEMLCRHMEQYGLIVSPEQIFIMQGLSDSLNAISVATMRPGMEILYNSPVWVPEKQRLQAYGIRMQGMPMDNEGLAKDPLLKYLHSSPAKKMIYVTPCYANPTGITMSRKRREDIMNICKNTTTPLIEVDSYRDLSPALPPPIASMDETGSVVYIGTLGEILPMGYNMSWVVAPQALMERFYHYKAQSDFSTRVSQLFFYSLLKSGIYYEYRERFRQYIAKRRLFTQRILEEYLGDTAIWNANGHPLVYWLKFHKDVDTESVYNNLQLTILRGVDYAPGLEDYFTVSSMNLSKNTFIKNIKYLADLVNASINQRKPYQP